MKKRLKFKELKEEAKQKIVKKQKRKKSFLESKRQQNNEMIHKQQMLERKVKENNAATTKGSDELKVMYTNIDGIITRKLELVDYLQEKKPEIVCLTETKLCEEIQTNIENNNYNIWRKDKKDKKGGGLIFFLLYH